MRGRGAEGFVSVQYVAAGAVALLVFAVCANLLVQSFTVAVVRDALDSGVRAGTVSAAGARDCEARAGDVLRGLLTRSVTRRVTLHCRRVDGWVTAQARVRLRSWVPGVGLERWAVLEASAPVDP